jgi:restriction system protein
MLPVLRIAAKGVTRVPEVAEVIANELGLSEAERAQMLPSGKQLLLHNRIHWAKFYMTKAGLIELPSRGQFVASKAGIALLAKNPSRVDVALLKSIPVFDEYYATVVGASSSDTAPGPQPTIPLLVTPEEQVDSAEAVLKSALRAELLQRIAQNSPTFFERLIVDLLVAMGYGGSHEDAALRLGRTGDGGIDGVIDEDRLGLDRIYIQAKRYAATSSVGRPEIQGFVGSLVGFGATKGVFVTTSSFSAPAVDFVRHLPQRVVLIDGARLSELMIEHDVGVRVIRTVALKRLDEDFFSEE